MPQHRGRVVGVVLQRGELDVDAQELGLRGQVGPHDCPLARPGDDQPEQQPAVHHHLLGVLQVGTVRGQHVQQPGRHAGVVAAGDGDEQAHADSPASSSTAL